MIPEQLKRYFWDTTLSSIDVKKHANYIISRLFEYGDFPTLRWVMRQYDKAKIITTLEQSRSLSQRTKLFWLCYLKHQ